jgi:hypothetical protein
MVLLSLSSLTTATVQTTSNTRKVIAFLKTSIFVRDNVVLLLGF